MNKYITILTIFLSFWSQAQSKKDLLQLAAVEHYPQDTFLDSVTEKRALIVLAHDDDDAMMSGTIAKLHATGWTIKQISLNVTPLENGKTIHPSTIICEGNEAIVDDRIYRKDLETTQYPWLPFPKNQFDSVFEKDKISNALIKKINLFNPTVIFTLDNEMGAYGHPDHVFISQLVLDLSEVDSIHSKRIYQGVYTDHMEKQIIEIWFTNKMRKTGYPNPYFTGKQVYHVSGMPTPNVEINIKNQASVKMNYLRSYSEDARKNFRKFIPYYEEFDADVYFGIFDREFFKIYSFE